MIDILIYILIVLGLTPLLMRSNFESIKALGQATPLLATVIVYMLYSGLPSVYPWFAFGQNFSAYFIAITVPTFTTCTGYLLAQRYGYVKLPPNISSAPHKKQFRKIACFFMRSISTPWVLYPFFWALTEEIGWRGYLLTRLLQETDKLWANTITGLIWALYHYPMFYKGYAMETLEIKENLAMFTAMIMPLAHILGGVTISSQSIWPTTLFHFMLNHQCYFWHGVFTEKRARWSLWAGESSIVSIFLFSAIAFYLYI